MNKTELELNAMKLKIAEEYLSSLADLNVNSKPLINMLTILAEENIEHSEVIVKVVEQHIAKVDPEVKLPVLYLIDSIVKNVGGKYIQLFSQCIVNIFVGVFDKVKENVREKMYALRQTWVEVFPPQKLYTLDVKVKCIDQNWPITAKVPTPSIHVNPKFLTNESNDPNDMQAKLLAKQRELLELQNRKLEMELEATKLRLQVQEQRLQSGLVSNVAVVPSQSIPNSLGSVGSENSSIVQNNQHNVHVNKNYPFNQVRGNLRKNAITNNAQGNFPPTTNTNANRPRVNPVNSAMLNALSRRDPRLARQQQHHLQKQEKKPHTDNNIVQTVKGVADHKLEQKKINDNQKNRNGEDSIILFGRKRSEEQTSEEKGNNKLRNKNSNSSSKDRRSPIDKELKGTLKISEKSKAASKGDRNERHKDKERHRDKDKRYSEKKSKEGSDDKNRSKEEKNQKDSNSCSSPLMDISMSPKSNDVSGQDRINSKRSPTKISSNFNLSPSKDSKTKEPKSRNNSPSPSNKDKLKSEKEIPEKRIKLSTNMTTTTLNSSPVSATTSLTSLKPTPEIYSPSIISKEKNRISKLEQNNNDVNQSISSSNNVSKDIDLRTIPKIDINMKTLKDSDIIDNMTSDDINSDNMENLVEVRNINQKRMSSDDFNLGEPIAKKSKAQEIDEKIDILFGTEDVDLRKLPTSDVSPPPPPMISSESENWAKVKGVKSGSSVEKLTSKSSLDDVRAKLAKAAKSNNYSFGKGAKKSLKKPIVEEFNEDSQDGACENIRTIISQAQELFESKSISSEQYNTLVKTAIQINETNKLKEAQRRESLTLQNDKENKNEESKIILTAKEQRKKLPKIPKTTDSKQINLDSKSMEHKKSEVTQEFNDITPKRSNSPFEKSDEKEKDSNAPTRRRRKESKWSPMTPWEIQQQKQQNWMLHQHSGGVPPPPFPPKLLAIPPGPASTPLQNHWQNPPAIIFGGNAIQPIAAATLSNMNNSVNSGNSKSGPAFSNSVNNPQDDIVRTIPIDGVSKEIRIYDDVAIVFMDWDQPREIGFQNGQRRIIIDNQDPFALNFNDDFVNITIGGSMHRIKYGFPSRELYIDANWYECYFGGPSLSIPLDGKLHILQIEGPPPQVHIGPIRQDLVIGKINLVIDAHVVIPVFLDSRPQSFELYKKKHVIQFANELCTALIDNEPIDVEYGGLPKSFNINGEKHFIRFTTLPNGIIPGKVKIKNMLYTKPMENFLQEEIKPEIEIKPIAIPPLLPGISSLVTPQIPIVVPITVPEILPKITDIALGTNSILNMSPNLPSVDSTLAIPTIPALSTIPANKTTAIATSTVLPSSLNIDDLFQKLIASGILNNQTKEEEEKKNEEEQQKEINKIIEIDLKKSESIKTRQIGIVNALFSGMQCSSCGLRFPPEQTIKYSQHLDWHFRQNRRERDSNRKAHSRKWYYDLSEWLQYEEIEDLEDREKNWFETQQVELESDENSNQKCSSPQPSCRAEAGDVNKCCEICFEKFEHFYNEELEEWHLKSAIKVDKAFYHPICYKDLQDAILKEAAQKEEPQEQEVKKSVDETECIEIDDSVYVKQEKDDKNCNKETDEDDDVIVLPNEEPSITEIPDDDDEDNNENLTSDAEKPAGVINENVNFSSENQEKDKEISLEKENVQKINEKLIGNASMEDDIVIQEPQIPFQDLDNYVEKDLSHLNEDSLTQSSFANIKIKEEPKDDDDDEVIEEEDDVFEDVGTVEIINDSIDSSISTTPILEVEEETNENKNSNDGMSENDELSSVNISIDGNVRVNQLPSQKLGVNKIKINIAKNIVNSSNNSNLNNNSNNNNNNTNELNNIEPDKNKITATEPQQQQNIQISTIPVITTNQNFNRREFNVYNSSTSTSISQNSATVSQNSATITTTSSSNKNNSNNLSNSNKNNLSSNQIISNVNKSNPTTSLLSNSNTLISIQTMDIEPNKQKNDGKSQENDETPKIEFKYRTELQNVEFKNVPKLEKGFETSGLCSIM